MWTPYQSQLQNLAWSIMLRSLPLNTTFIFSSFTFCVAVSIAELMIWVLLYLLYLCGRCHSNKVVQNKENSATMIERNKRTWYLLLADKDYKRFFSDLTYFGFLLIERTLLLSQGSNAARYFSRSQGPQPIKLFSLSSLHYAEYLDNFLKYLWLINFGRATLLCERCIGSVPNL